MLLILRQFAIRLRIILKWIDRIVEKPLREAAATRPAVLLTGLRQSGKSSLLRKVFPDATYVTLDVLRYAEEAQNNPTRFLKALGPGPVILDEIQYAPHLFRELKILIDEDRTPGRWLLTGSQKLSLLEQAKESLAGRIALLSLETLGAQELQSLPPQEREALVWKGGFPETWSNPLKVEAFLEDYISTYLEKDVRSVLQTTNWRDFHRFLRVCALRAGQLINLSDMARDVGISPNTAKAWLSTLEVTGVITLLEPLFANLSKRLAKTPKLYFNDQGLLNRLANRPLDDNSGATWENFVFNELIRTPGVQASRNLFFYRDQNLVEIDFLIETPTGTVLLEAKDSERPDARKLRFGSVAPLVSTPKCFVACRVPEPGFFAGEGYDLFNPLLTPLVLFAP